MGVLKGAKSVLCALTGPAPMRGKNGTGLVLSCVEERRVQLVSSFQAGAEAHKHAVRKTAPRAATAE